MTSPRLGLALLLLAFGPGVASAETATATERQLMTLVNQARSSAGLVPLRSDYRLWLLADDRANAMATTDVLSHGPHGSLEAAINGRGIQWFRYGEVVAYSTASPSSAANALFQLFASSPPHWELLMSERVNYLGVGMASSGSGRTYGAIVVTESMDRTGARATMVSASVSGNDVTWKWHGADPALQTRTAGLRDFTVQQRTDDGAWSTVSTSTTSTTAIGRNRTRGQWYGLRVRARDRAGNVGPWTTELRVWVQ